MNVLHIKIADIVQKPWLRCTRTHMCRKTSGKIRNPTFTQPHSGTIIKLSLLPHTSYFCSAYFSHIHTYYYSFQQRIYISWFDNATIKKDFFFQTIKQTICSPAPFFHSFDSVIHNLLFIPVFCITNGLRIRTNQGPPNYQEGNGFLKNMCQWRNWQRSDSGPGEGPNNACVSQEEIVLFHLRQTQFHINE